MTLSTIQPGDRIRLVTFLVGTPGAPDRSVRKVNLRFAWTGPEPEHMCFPESCPTCAAEATRIVQRRLPHGVQVTGVAAIRDGQALATGRPTRQLVAA